MKTGKPLLIAGIPIAGLALHSFSATNNGVASAWTPPAPHATRRSHRSRRSTPSSSASRRSVESALASSTEIDMESLHLTPELTMMTNAFSSIPDEKTRHKQLLYMASKLPGVEESVYVPENKVPGCLSTVHVDCTVEKGEEEGLVVNYFGDSDGLLTKGLLALLIRGLSGCTPDQIEAVDPQFIQAAKISQTLTPGRNNGFLNMLAVMKRKASEASEKDSAGVDGGTTTVATAVENSAETVSDETDDKPMYTAIISNLMMLKPTSITLTDNSAQHVGDAGAKGWEDGESHFALEIVSEAFDGLNVIKRHKLIYMLLGEVMPKIHALEIDAKTSSEME